MKKQLKLLLVDFDGVLSDGRFYYSPDPVQKELGDTAANVIFNAETDELVRQWMKGEYSYSDMHDIVERQTGVDARQLDRLLRESVKHMLLNHPLLSFIASLRSGGVAVSLFTNNMDIFDTVSRAHHQLDEHFDYIYSSSQYGQLKFENDILLQTAMRESGVEKEGIALVDDSRNSFKMATKYGIGVFLYDKYEESQPAFERWLEKGYEW